MLKNLWRRIAEAWNRDRLDREAQEELAYHLEMEVASRVRDGADAEDARRRTRIEIGDVEDVREQLREGRAGFWLDSLLKDAAFALRMLRKRPGLSAACVLTIAVGVGARTAL